MQQHRDSITERIRVFLLTFVLVISSGTAIGTTDAVVGNGLPEPDIAQLVAAFKEDSRGPYQAIRWFCKDGSVLPANQRCPQPGGEQHALHKDVVAALAAGQHLFLGQILAGTPYQDFLDADNLNSRLKQYQIEKFLRAIDDGWIMRRGRYYRGAFQAEDEERWSSGFLLFLLADNTFMQRQFFLARQLVKDLPYPGAQADRWRNIRQLARNIAELDPAFENLRIKLHGQPSADDLLRLIQFREQEKDRLSAPVITLLDSLEEELSLVFQPPDDRHFSRYEKILPPGFETSRLLREFLAMMPDNREADNSERRILLLADLLFEIRIEVLKTKSANIRLALLALSNELERILLLTASGWQPETLPELFVKFRLLTKAATGSGFLELWEWDRIQSILDNYATISSQDANELLDASSQCRRIVEWGSSTMRAVYRPEIDLFASFEPLAAGFFDDRIRASILLELGRTAGRIAARSFRDIGSGNMVMNIDNQAEIRGLNPGFALGELEVIPTMSEEISFSNNTIYILARAPADLKPVAGIATVSEGNLVSHVQLLSRNLGIPNAVLSEQNVQDLLPFSGRRMFYAVSPLGRVVLKPEEEMTTMEKELFSTGKRPEKKVRVPVDSLILDRTDIVSLKEVNAADSGRICGPKAANLGQLKKLFPASVADGLVIPFGIFRRHLDQPMPETGDSYWHFLQETFQTPEPRIDDTNQGTANHEKYIIERLARLREAIGRMPLLSDLTDTLQQKFTNEFGRDFGAIGVFIRSDTNMEDLKDFTGAGLNLTVFNVREPEKILQGIRDVWASPFTERSYRWRQKFLENPENVFPSILILPSIRVEKSGVMITTGLGAGLVSDNTVAFSRGVGGAVEGQAAETWLLGQDNAVKLLAPARETLFTVLPESGGLEKKTTFFDEQLLNDSDLALLADTARMIRQRLPDSPAMKAKGPYDIELGIKEDKIWLFQARPFVENKRARSSNYLKSLDIPLAPQEKKQ